MLKDSKTEVVFINSCFVKYMPPPDTTIGVSVVITSCAVRNRGVTMDKALDVKDHIRKIVQSASFAIYKIGCVSSHNALLYGIPATEIDKLQPVQPQLLGWCRRKHEHIIPILHELHWLPTVYKNV